MSEKIHFFCDIRFFFIKNPTRPTTCTAKMSVLMSVFCGWHGYCYMMGVMLNPRSETIYKIYKIS